MLKPQNRRKAFKLFMGMLAIVLLFPTSVNAESKPSLTQPTYKQTLQSYYQQIEEDFKGQEPQRYREISQILHALFDSPAVKIPFRAVAKKGSQRSIRGSGAIYFAQEDIFIICDGLPKTLTDYSQPEEFLATLNGKIYTWEDGSNDIVPSPRLLKFAQIENLNDCHSLS